MTRMKAATLIALLCSLTHAQTITVDTIEDRVDFAPPRQIEQLPGPDGFISFREAATAANNTEGPQTIAFAIPMDQWWLDETLAILRVEETGVYISGDQTTIDFTTQTDFTGDTNPNGPEVGIYGVHPNYHGTGAMFIAGNGSTVRGLGYVWNRISVVVSGNDNRIVGCRTQSVEIDSYLPHIAAGNVIGGLTAEDANVLDQIKISCAADDNIVIGNRIHSVDVVGSPYTDICPWPARNRIGGPTPQERNVIAGFGHFGEEGFPLGEGVEVVMARDTIIEGNYIGTTPDGMARVPSWTSGVEVADSLNTTIRGNLISGLWVEGHNHYDDEFFGEAIHLNAINDDNEGVTIQGNLIGTDATGQNPILTLNGIVATPLTSFQKSYNVLIGGDQPEHANLIAFNERTGVSVLDSSDMVRIAGNSIHSNGLLGIDLGPYDGGDGVTPNDQGDADTGPNGLQNFPVLHSAVAAPWIVVIEGQLSSRPGRSYVIEFYSSPVCDPSGYGEGEEVLGSIQVETNGNGETGFAAELQAQVQPGQFITATATDTGAVSTSEFSACIPVEGGCYADFTGDGVLDLFDFLGYVNAFNGGEEGAECDGSGALDLFDFLCFVNAFNEGC
jgi:hypothetical protein